MNVTINSNNLSLEDQKYYNNKISKYHKEVKRLFNNTNIRINKLLND